MTKKSILMAIAIVMILATATACNQKTNTIPPANAQKEVQTQRGADMMNVVDDGMYDPEEEKMKEEQEQDPQQNALDYMAPGHRQARERVKQVQELRQKALDDQKNDIEKLNSR